ncbi:hypothetical protein HDV06_000406 [Boothiomyces sp. JEL0866]|nr:hypothetical protein HDV06_000406 [Boothiomyces sp. JEL0866]
MPKVTIKKPLNSFFLYRKSKKQEIIRNYDITKSHEISKKAAELWQLESKETKDYYAQLSLDEHNKFKELNPDFDWQPWKKRAKTKKIQSTPVSSYTISPIASTVSNAFYTLAVNTPEALQTFYPSPVESAIYFPLNVATDFSFNQYELFGFQQEINDLQANQPEPFNFEEFLDFNLC